MKKKFKMLVLGLSFMLCSNFAFASENNIQNPNQNQNNPQQNEQNDEVFFEKLKKSLKNNGGIDENNDIEVYEIKKHKSGQSETLFDYTNNINHNLNFDTQLKKIIKDNFCKNSILKLIIETKKNNVSINKIVMIYFTENLKNSYFEISEKKIQKKVRNKLLEKDCILENDIPNKPNFTHKYFYSNNEDENDIFKTIKLKHLDEALETYFEEYQNSNPNDNENNKFEFDILTSVNKENKLPKPGKFRVEFKKRNDINSSKIDIEEIKDLPENEYKSYFKNAMSNKILEFFNEDILQTLVYYDIIDDFKKCKDVGELYSQGKKIIVDNKNMTLDKFYFYVSSIIKKSIEEYTNPENIFFAITNIKAEHSEGLLDLICHFDPYTKSFAILDYILHN